MHREPGRSWTPPRSPRERLDWALDFAWEITKAKFRDGEIVVDTEAPLQHQYGLALNRLGNLLTTHRDERWIVDLEVRESDLVLPGKNRYLDLVCEVVSPEIDEHLKAGVEMKFKTGRKGAPAGGVQALYDVHSLELACEGEYDVGRFLMATENPYYWQAPSSSSIREEFGIYQGRSIASGETLVAESSTARGVLDSKAENDRITMQGSYEFDWEDIGMEFRFLSISIE